MIALYCVLDATQKKLRADYIKEEVNKSGVYNVCSANSTNSANRVSLTRQKSISAVISLETDTVSVIRTTSTAEIKLITLMKSTNTDFHLKLAERNQTQRERERQKLFALKTK